MDERTARISKALSGLATVKTWNDRIYINVAGSGGSYRGEQTHKLWIDAAGNVHNEYGKGMRSDAFDSNLEATLEVLAGLDLG